MRLSFCLSPPSICSIHVPEEKLLRTQPNSFGMGSGLTVQSKVYLFWGFLNV